MYTHIDLYLWFMYGIPHEIQEEDSSLSLRMPFHRGVLFYNECPWFLLGDCRVLYFFICPCFFPRFVKRLDWGQDWRTKQALNRWEIVGGMVKSMWRVGGQFWKSVLDVKLTQDCLIKSDFVEQKNKCVSRLNSVKFRFIYRDREKNWTGSLPIPILSQTLTCFESK